MSEHVILLVSVFFLLFQSPAAFPDVVCNPQEKAINLAESSKVVLECKVVVAVGEMPEFEWSTSDSKAIKKMNTTEHTDQQGAWKNVTSISTIYSKDKSPTFLTEVRSTHRNKHIILVPIFRLMFKLLFILKGKNLQNKPSNSCWVTTLHSS